MMRFHWSLRHFCRINSVRILGGIHFHSAHMLLIKWGIKVLQIVFVQDASFPWVDSSRSFPSGFIHQLFNILRCHPALRRHHLLLHMINLILLYTQSPLLKRARSLLILSSLILFQHLLSLVATVSCLILCGTECAFPCALWCNLHGNTGLVLEFDTILRNYQKLLFW